jgi:hypothetical protein
MRVLPFPGLLVWMIKNRRATLTVLHLLLIFFLNVTLFSGFQIHVKYSAREDVQSYIYLYICMSIV